MDGTRRRRTRPEPAVRGGYGSARHRRASGCARAVRFGRRDDDAPALGPVLRGLPALAVYLLTLPRVDVPTSADGAGLILRDHLSLRRWGMPRFRLAQGVLHLPPDFDAYLCGRRRQAVRTNLHRARERGMECHGNALAAWNGRVHELGTIPVEHWWAVDGHGGTVAEAWLSVDEHCALLHGMASTAAYGRWALHTAVVERLCRTGCSLLITNSHDAVLMPPGQQHFQHLLGYSVARLRPVPAPGTPPTPGEVTSGPPGARGQR